MSNIIKTYLEMRLEKDCRIFLNFRIISPAKGNTFEKINIIPRIIKM